MSGQIKQIWNIFSIVCETDNMARILHEEVTGENSRIYVFSHVLNTPFHNRKVVPESDVETRKTVNLGHRLWPNENSRGQNQRDCSNLIKNFRP